MGEENKKRETREHVGTRKRIKEQVTIHRSVSYPYSISSCLLHFSNWLWPFGGHSLNKQTCAVDLSSPYLSLTHSLSISLSPIYFVCLFTKLKVDTSFSSPFCSIRHTYKLTFTLPSLSLVKLSLFLPSPIMTVF